VRRDWEKGRIYVPQEDQERFQCKLEEAGPTMADKTLANFRALMRYQVERTAGYFQRGRHLVQFLPSSYQSEIDLILRGG
ncbi:MAG TPA: squalene/phytoene synthase family protein, partial [Gemmatales bacterium]|nr:squalene/phytoene synthase family protein [Gemmatales bacterium]